MKVNKLLEGIISKAATQKLLFCGCAFADFYIIKEMDKMDQ